MLDIVDIRTAAKNGVLSFYVEAEKIYCRDNTSEEVVKVSDTTDQYQF